MAVRSVPREFRKDPADPSDLTDLSDHERYALYARWLDHADPAIRANALICLIHQANYLLDRQIAALEKQFVEGGGHSEQLAADRIAHRNAEQSRDPNIPKCPQCDGLMALRTAKNGKKRGSAILALHQISRVQRHSQSLA